MSIHHPYFFIKPTVEGSRICHNCDGGIGFMATEDISEETKRLVELAIEEGKRQKAKEIADALFLRSKP